MTKTKISEMSRLSLSKAQCMLKTVATIDLNPGPQGPGFTSDRFLTDVSKRFRACPLCIKNPLFRLLSESNNRVNPTGLYYSKSIFYLNMVTITNTSSQPAKVTSKAITFIFQFLFYVLLKQIARTNLSITTISPHNIQ